MKLRHAVIVAVATLGLTGCSLDNNTITPPPTVPQSAETICANEGDWFWVPTPYTIYQMDPQLNSAGYLGFCAGGSVAAVKSHVGYTALNDTSPIDDIN